MSPGGSVITSIVTLTALHTMYAMTVGVHFGLEVTLPALPLHRGFVCYFNELTAGRRRPATVVLYRINEVPQ